MQARPCLEENKYLQKLAIENPLIQGVIGWFDFDSNADEQLEFFKLNTKIKGFRHMLQDEKNPSDYIQNHKNFNLGIKKIQKNELLYSVLIHQKDLAMGVSFCERHDQHELIIDHLAKPKIHSDIAFDEWTKFMKMLANMPHVNLKISGLLIEGGIKCQAKDFQAHIDVVMEFFGPERLLWGSDWPVSYATHDYITVMKFWDEWTKDWTDSERFQVEMNTPKRLYKL